MKVCQWFDIYYLWIDSLCIIQGDGEDWHNQAGRMADIYEGAYVVIFSSAVRDSTTGFLLDWEKRYKEEYNDFRDVKHAIRSTEILDNSPPFDTIPPNHDKTDNEYPIYSRGWCFQEQLVAIRILHFLRSDIFFQCRSEYRGEFGSVPASTGLKLDFTIIERGKGSIGSPLKPYRVYNTSFWLDLIENFSEKRLTYASDKLPALSGIASRFYCASHRCGQYIAGMWERHLMRYLLLYTPFWLDHKTQRLPNFVAPSFAWPSIDGRLEWLRYPEYSEFSAEVIKWVVKPCGANLFGNLSHASLTISGASLPGIIVSRVSSHGRPGVKLGDVITKPVLLDVPDELDTLEGKGVFCLKLGEINVKAVGLLLQPLTTSATLKRVGFFQSIPNRSFEESQKDTFEII